MKTSLKILLVEDNEGDIMLTTETLNEASFDKELSVIKDGWEAVEYLEKKGKYNSICLPDLVLLDVNLPRLNGYEVLKKIRSNHNTCHIPVIMLTTSSSQKDIHLSIEHKANFYMIKPVNSDQLVQMGESINNFCQNIIRHNTPD